MVRRWLALVLGLAVVFVGGSFLISYLTRWPAAKPIHQPGPIIVISAPTLSWDQVSDRTMPNLWQLATHGAVGSTTTRSLSSHSCDSQSWLTFGAGTRTTYGTQGPMTPAGQKPQPCWTMRPPTPLSNSPTTGAGTLAGYPIWQRVRNEDLARKVPADPSKLVTKLQQGGQCVTAAGRYAPMAATAPSGRLQHYVSDPATVDPRSCPVTFVSLPRIDDALLGDIVRKAPADATIVVAGFSDETGPEVLHTVVVSGPGVPRGLLTSNSTLQPGVLQLTDLSALVLSRLGDKAPNLREGRVPAVQPRHDATSSITDAGMIAMQLRIEHGLSADFLARFAVTMLGLLMVGFLWWLVRLRRGRRGLSSPLRWWLRGCAALTASMPVSTWLVGLVHWWAAPEPRTALAWGIVGIAAVISAIALGGPWRTHPVGPAVVIGGITLTVILLDVIHGSPLQFTSIMGLQPVYGGRFYGMGNVGYALVATSALLVAALLAGLAYAKGNRGIAVATVVLIGGATLLVDGMPTWGADGGGPLAMFPAFAYLALNAAGLALTWRRATAIVCAAVVIVGGIAVLDYLRGPSHRSHLGDFVSQVRNQGNFSGLTSIVHANWKMLTSSGLTVLVPLLLLVPVVVILTPSRWPGRILVPVVSRVGLLGPGLGAIVVCWILGFASNDSGVSIPPTGVLLLVPLLTLIATAVVDVPQHPGRVRGTLAHPKPAVPQHPPAEKVPAPRDASDAADVSES